MTLQELKNNLLLVNELTIVKPDGTIIPKHFHITEVGLQSKHFIDCGGTIREEKNATMQVWVANDTEHRLEPQKFLKIIELSEKLFNNENPEVEIEYQDETIGKYGLRFDGTNFILELKETACLAQDSCGIPEEKRKVKLADLSTPSNCCTPGGGCC
jgi:hypothetical protein